MYGFYFEIDVLLLIEIFGYQIEEYEKYIEKIEEINKFLETNGFKRLSGNVYLGDNSINVVTVITTIQKLAKEFEWFDVCVKKIELLQIDEIIDLKPAFNIVT